VGLTIDSPVYIDSIIPKSEERHVKAKEIIKLASGSRYLNLRYSLSSW
jgi:hypothetical protein